MNSINIELRVLSGMDSDQGAPQLSAVGNQESSEASDVTPLEPGTGDDESFEVVPETGEYGDHVQNEDQALHTNPIRENPISHGHWIERMFAALSYYTSWLFIQLFSQPFRQSFTVGILIFSEKDECKWLEHLLKSDVRVDKVICCSGDEEGLKEKLAQCSFIIFYHRGRFEMTDSMIASTVTQSTSKLENKNMLIVFGHLEDKTHEDKMKEKLQERLGRECNQLFFTKAEIRQYERLCGLYPLKKLDQIRAALSPAFICLTGHEDYFPSPTNHTVGIVSRSAESDYKWLGQYLKDTFQADVRPIYISNSGKLKFWDDVSHCTFAILYHTKRRGRINITDVTDSLYDEEIQHLASALGKDNVIVVADDLDNSSIEERERILLSQPSIGRYARDLILFTKQETDPNYERLVTQQEQEDERNLKEKLDTLRNIIGKAKATMMSGAADTTGVHGQEEPSNTPHLRQMKQMK